MVLWTIQPLTLYTLLLEQGILHCNPSMKGFLALEFDNFYAAYNWISAQMKFRVGSPPTGVQYPFWAWALIDGVSKKPDLRRTEFNNYVGEYVVLEIEISETEVLLSDEENWHYVLNNWYLHDVHDKNEKWEEVETWFYSLSPSKKNYIKRKSWERIFDKCDENNNWKFVQATFWELKAERIKSVRKFTGRGKVNDY